MSENSLVFCRASYDMIGEICGLERQYFSDPWSEGAFVSALNNPLVTFTVCKKQNEILGYILGMTLPPEGEVLNIAVCEKARREGIGKQLLALYLSHARSVGAFAVYLEVRRSNSHAIALYEKCGFVKIGERKNYYSKPKEDAVLMLYEKQ